MNLKIVQKFFVEFWFGTGPALYSSRVISKQRLSTFVKVIRTRAGNIRRLFSSKFTELFVQTPIIFRRMIIYGTVGIFCLSLCPGKLFAQDTEAIFDDQALLEGYTEKYLEEPLENILAMIEDDTLSPYKTAGAVKVFRENFLKDLIRRERQLAVKTLIRRLKTTDSPFVQIEIMHTLCIIDRYKYFESLAPSLIDKLEHYNDTIGQMAFTAVNDVVKSSRTPRAREARIVFNQLRRQFFLKRKKLRETKVPDDKIKRQLELLRWSVKILGTQELKKLPSEILTLL